MNYEVISLISETETKDKFGVTQLTPTSTDIFAKVDTVGAKEFFNAGNTGIKPVFKFSEVKPDEYHGEQIIEYNGNRYSVYRTYRAREDALELYVERKAGTVVNES